MDRANQKASTAPLSYEPPKSKAARELEILAREVISLPLYSVRRRALLGEILQRLRPYSSIQLRRVLRKGGGSIPVGFLEEDFLQDAGTHILAVFPRFDPARGAFINFVTTVLINFTKRALRRAASLAQREEPASDTPKFASSRGEIPGGEEVVWGQEVVGKIVEFYDFMAQSPHPEKSKTAAAAGSMFRALRRLPVPEDLPQVSTYRLRELHASLPEYLFSFHDMSL